MRIRACLAPLLVGAAWGLVHPDVVVRRDGGRVEGEVLTLDAARVIVRTPRGQTAIPRSEVAAIEFLPLEAPLPPLRVEIRNIKSDDSIDVLLDDDPVIVEARDEGDWIDLTPRLKDGNNPLRFRIHNERGTWAYRLSLRINGASTILSCGSPNRASDPCRCCGKTGFETGRIDDLPILWLFVDRRAGRAEVLP